VIIARTPIIGFGLLLLAAALSFAGHLPASYVTPEWLATHRGEQDLRIVDVSFSRKDYEEEHIPESVFVDWRADLADGEEKHYFILPSSFRRKPSKRS
jgi:3-mercaptopyruvate sulfurtransferase SseA